VKRTGRCVALALALSATPVAAAAPYAPPAPDVLSALTRRHHPHDWWRVTVDSARYEVRVRTVGAAGIAGLQPRHRSDLVPERIAWGEIARIDARKSHFRSKQVQGVIYGGIAGPVLAALGGLQDPLPVFAVFAGAGLGGWLGGLYGDTQVHELPLYISRTLLAPAPAPVAAKASAGTTASHDSAQRTPAAVASDSTSTASHSEVGSDSTRDVLRDAAPLAPAAGSAAPTAPRIARGEPTAQVLNACRMIRPTSILRMRADFGMFEGTAERAEPGGLSGLRMSSLPGAVASTPGVVSWNRIALVEMKGNNAGSGAKKGALIGGAVGGVVGLFAIAVASAPGWAGGGGSTDPGGSWILAGAGIGAAVGAGLGAAVGSGTTSWRIVYRR
jgi:hypothetical protein